MRPHCSVNLSLHFVGAFESYQRDIEKIDIDKILPALIDSERERIRKAIAVIDAGLVTSLNEVVAGVLNGRPSLEGDDAPFYRVHAFEDLKRIAKSVVGKYAADDTTSDELLLPGFKHLCKAYPMSRDGDVVIVPVDMCSDEELKARAAQLDEMAKGCVAHAREIREYVLARARIAA